MIDYNIEKNVFVIVHGQRQLFETRKSKLAIVGFKMIKLYLPKYINLEIQAILL